MGFSKKSQIDGGLESEGRKWVIAGIPLRSSLKPINTKLRGKDIEAAAVEDDDESCSTTPTGKEARIPERLPCPPAPRKRRPASRCNNNRFNGVREFFTPPDLETVFIRRQVEKAN